MHARPGPLATVVFAYAVHAGATLAGQMLWIKQLGLSAGLNLAALGIGLAVFVAGMGAGSLLLAATASRCGRRPLLVFTALQLILAGAALTVPRALAWMETLPAWASAGDSDPAVWPLRVGMVFVLLPAAVAAGAAFPLVASVVARPGALYALGVGASAAGALAPAALIPALGMSGVAALVVLMHLASAALTLGVASRWPSTIAGQGTAAPRERAAGPSSGAIVFTGTLLGTLMLGLEVAAVRFVWLIVDATPQAEGIVVATALLALGAGAGAGAWMSRRMVPSSVVVVVGLLAAAAGPIALIHAAASLARLADRVGTVMAALPMLAWTVVTVVPAVGALGLPLAGAGMALSALLSGVAPQGDAPVTRLARLWAGHHAGSAVGALVTAFVLVPAVGLTLTLALLGGIAALAVLVVARPDRPGWRWATAVTSAAVLGLAGWSVATGDVTYREQAAGPRRVIFHYEDTAGVTEVIEEPGTGRRILVSSRLRQEGASGRDDVVVQRLQGYLPILLHPAPRRLLAIGVGTGISLGPALRDDVVEVSVVEISRGVLAATPLFAREHKGILAHPKTRVMLDDGRAFVRLGRERYDVIVQDLFFPYQAGVAGLYTVEHYRRAAARLARGGHLGQWIALNQLTEESLRSLLASFTQVLPHTTLWLNGGYLLLLGAEAPLAVPLARFVERAVAPDALGGLAAVGSDPGDLLSRFVARTEALAAWLQDAPINTEDRPFIEYDLWRQRARVNSIGLAVDNLRVLLARLEPLDRVVDAASPAEAAKLARLGEARRRLLEGVVARAEGREREARAAYEAALALNPTSHQARAFVAADRRARGARALHAGHLDEAANWLTGALALADLPAARFDLALIDARRGRHAEAAAAFRRLVDDMPGQPVVHYNLALALAHLGRHDDALVQLRAALALDPGHAPSAAALRVLRAARGDESDPGPPQPQQ
jgi:spermidine synthase